MLRCVASGDSGSPAFVRDGEQHEFIQVYLSLDFSKPRSFTVGLTDSFYEHGLDWIAALAPYLTSCEPA